MALKVSQKQLQIDKASQRMIIITSIAAFVVVFCLVSAQSLFGQMLYQNKVVTAKKTALLQLNEDQDNIEKLKSAYTQFVSSPQNIIGGNAEGTGSEDGDNAKIVLDALPSKYDFPALATSLEKLLTSENITINSITGTDDELLQGATAGSGAPQSMPIPFQVSATGNYDAIQNLTKTFEASIRPIQIQSLSLTGSEGSLQLSVTAQTYYQPNKVFTIDKKVIK